MTTVISHQGWNIRVGSPEGYTRIHEVEGATPDLAREVAALMQEVGEAEDRPAPDPDKVAASAVAVSGSETVPT